MRPRQVIRGMPFRGRCWVVLWSQLPSRGSEGQEWGRCNLPSVPGGSVCLWHWHLERDGNAPSTLRADRMRTSEAIGEPSQEGHLDEQQRETNTLKLEGFTVVVEGRELKVYEGAAVGTPTWTIPVSEIPRLYDFLGTHLKEPAGIR